MLFLPSNNILHLTFQLYKPTISGPFGSVVAVVSWFLWMCFALIGGVLICGAYILWDVGRSRQKEPENELTIRA